MKQLLYIIHPCIKRHSYSVLHIIPRFQHPAPT